MDSTHSGSPLASNPISSLLLTFTLLVLASACTNTGLKESAGSASTLGQVFRLEDEAGQASTLQLAGQASFVSFSSTWCEACKKHRKDFHRIYNDYKDKGIQFHFIRVGEIAADVRADLDAENAPFKHLFDKNGVVAKSFKIDTTPTVLIYNKNGKEIYRSDVYDDEEIKASLGKVKN
jgi:thioredoxin-related protein